MPSIVLKLQSCGKENCGCRREGKLHGPYFWLVTYKKDESYKTKANSEKGRKGRYVWKYLGKKVDQVVRMLVNGSEMPSSLGQKSIQLIEREIEEKVNEFFEDEDNLIDKNGKKTRTHPLIEDLNQWISTKLTSSTPSEEMRCK